jgi:hypothetical protein
VTRDDAAARRAFLTKLAAGSALLAVRAADPLVAAAQQASPRAAAPQGTPQWDDTWAAPLANAKYKAVIDAPEVGEGELFFYAFAFLDGCKQALGAADGEAQVAVVIRHSAIALAYDDAIWAKYQLGKRLKIKDPVTNKNAERNPYLSVPEGNTEAAWMAPLTITALGQRGVSFPCCNRATRYLASQISGWTHGDRNAIYEELTQHLVPGARLQPTGVYATMRAQQVGAAFMSAAG